MNIINKSAYHNISYLPKRVIKYIAIHYTAGTSSAPGSALNIANYFANTNVEASADFICDDRDIVQYNPDIPNYWTWAVGGTPYNTQGGRLYGIATNLNTISIEICSSYRGSVPSSLWPNDPNFYYTDAALANARELTKYLMKEYNIPVSNVIRHYDVNGKACPGIIGWNADTGDDSEWNAFKDSLIDDDTKPSKPSSDELYRVQIGAFKNIENARKMEAKVKAKGFSTYVPCIDGLYKIQVGAFKYKENAERQLAELKMNGFTDAFITSNASDEVKPKPKPQQPKFKVGDWVGVRSGAKDYNGNPAGGVVRDKVWYTLDELNGDRAVLDIPGICTPFHTKDLFK